MQCVAVTELTLVREKNYKKYQATQKLQSCDLNKVQDSSTKKQISSSIRLASELFQLENQHSV